MRFFCTGEAKRCIQHRASNNGMRIVQIDCEMGGEGRGWYGLLRILGRRILLRRAFVLKDLYTDAMWAPSSPFRSTSDWAIPRVMCVSSVYRRGPDKCSSRSRSAYSTDTMPSKGAPRASPTAAPTRAPRNLWTRLGDLPQGLPRVAIQMPFSGANRPTDLGIED